MNLTIEREMHLIARYKSGVITKLELEELFGAYQRIIRHYAFKVFTRIRPAQLELDDVIQIGYQLTANALNSFDPAMKIKFSSYLVASLKRSLPQRINGYKKIVHLPAPVIAAMNLIAQAIERLAAQGNYRPDYAQLAALTGLTVELVEHYLSLAQGPILSLDCLNAEGECLADSLADDMNTVNPEAIINKMIFRILLTQLDPVDRLIIHGRFYEQRSRAEIARTLGRRQQFVEYRERRALNKLANMALAFSLC